MLSRYTYDIALLSTGVPDLNLNRALKSVGGVDGWMSQVKLGQLRPFGVIRALTGTSWIIRNDL